MGLHWLLRVPHARPAHYKHLNSLVQVSGEENFTSTEMELGPCNMAIMILVHSEKNPLGLRFGNMIAEFLEDMLYLLATNQTIGIFGKMYTSSKNSVSGGFEVQPLKLLLALGGPNWFVVVAKRKRLAVDGES